MKQLSALGARRHAFFRGPRRMRTLGGRLEDPDILGPGAYGYYGGKMAAAWERALQVDAAASMEQVPLFSCAEQICIKLIHLLGFRTLTLKKKKQKQQCSTRIIKHGQV